MKKKYRVRKSAQNEFSAITGREAIQLSGSSDCLISPHTTTGEGVSIQHLAYDAYYRPGEDVIRRKKSDMLHRSVKVRAICGVDQCVKKEHLEAVFKPTKKEEAEEGAEASRYTSRHPGNDMDR